MNGWSAPDRFLRTDPRDVGCAQAMEMLHVYVDLVTAEHDAHLYFKRAKASELFLGDASYHREHLAAASACEGSRLAAGGPHRIAGNHSGNHSGNRAGRRRARHVDGPASCGQRGHWSAGRQRSDGAGPAAGGEADERMPGDRGRCPDRVSGRPDRLRLGQDRAGQHRPIWPQPDCPGQTPQPAPWRLPASG